MISGPEAAITEPDRKFGKIILDHIEESPDHVNQVINYISQYHSRVYYMKLFRSIRLVEDV